MNKISVSYEIFVFLLGKQSNVLFLLLNNVQENSKKIIIFAILEGVLL